MTPSEIKEHYSRSEIAISHRVSKAALTRVFKVRLGLAVTRVSLKLFRLEVPHGSTIEANPVWNRFRVNGFNGSKLTQIRNETKKCFVFLSVVFPKVRGTQLLHSFTLARLDPGKRSLIRT